MLHLPPDLVAQIEEHAREAYPNECCGLLIGAESEGVFSVDEVAPSLNLSENPATQFEVDMRLRLRLQRELRETGRAIIGHYHSHPDGPPRPSRRDLDKAWEHGLVWLILGIQRGVACTMGAFHYSDDDRAFTPLEVNHG